MLGSISSQTGDTPQASVQFITSFGAIGASNSQQAGLLLLNRILFLEQNLRSEQQSPKVVTVD